MKKYNLFIIFGVVASLVATTYILTITEDSVPTNSQTDISKIDGPKPSARLASSFSNTDFTKSEVDLDKILWGGVVKDGIPALTDPKFDAIADATTNGSTLGIYIEKNSVKKFYPYNILVAHEVVNDSIGDMPVAITFCPLCGSAIVFDRTLNGEVKEFGVSGFLHESNLIMYDRTDTPSLWSQARTEAIVGDQAGTKLELVSFQLLTLDEARKLNPDAQILSTDTGFGRSYDYDPYSGYEDTENTIFPITVSDKRFPAKEVFYIIPNPDDSSVAIRVSKLTKGETKENPTLDLTITKNDSGELITTDQNGERNGYYEMWFSWAQNHQDNGEVWDLTN